MRRGRVIPESDAAYAKEQDAEKFLSTHITRIRSEIRDVLVDNISTRLLRYQELVKKLRSTRPTLEGFDLDATLDLPFSPLREQQQQQQQNADAAASSAAVDSVLKTGEDILLLSSSSENNNQNQNQNVSSSSDSKNKNISAEKIEKGNDNDHNKKEQEEKDKKVDKKTTNIPVASAHQAAMLRALHSTTHTATPRANKLQKRKSASPVNSSGNSAEKNQEDQNQNNKKEFVTAADQQQQDKKKQTKTKLPLPSLTSPSSSSVDASTKAVNQVVAELMTNKKPINNNNISPKPKPQQNQNQQNNTSSCFAVDGAFHMVRTQNQNLDHFALPESTVSSKHQDFQTSTQIYIPHYNRFVTNSSFVPILSQSNPQIAARTKTTFVNWKLPEQLSNLLPQLNVYADLLKSEANEMIHVFQELGGYILLSQGPINEDPLAVSLQQRQVADLIVTNSSLMVTSLIGLANHGKDIRRNIINIEKKNPFPSQQIQTLNQGAAQMLLGSWDYLHKGFTTMRRLCCLMHNLVAKNWQVLEDLHDPEARSDKLNESLRAVKELRRRSAAAQHHQPHHRK